MGPSSGPKLLHPNLRQNLGPCLLGGPVYVVLSESGGPTNSVTWLSKKLDEPNITKNDTFSFEHIVAFLRMMRVNRKVTDSYWKYFGASHDQFVRMIVIIV